MLQLLGPPTSVLTSSSSPFTTSSASAITILADDFKRRYAEVDDKNLPIPQLVSQAERLIRALGASNLDNVIEYESVKIQADKVLEAMLAQAENCGGENGKRYAATAICACVHEKRWDSPETLRELRGLALTWITHFLFVFRCGGHSRQPNDTPSDVATPTIDGTSTYLDKTSAASRRDNLRLEILKRGGYQCIVTGWIEAEHPRYTQRNLGITRYELDTCYILRRAVAVFRSDRDYSSYISAPATFDILRNYAHLSEEVISNLKEMIDDPSNAFLVAPHLHRGWEKFRWYLKSTETPDKYVIKSLDDASSLSLDNINRTIQFQDHSREFREFEESSKAPGIDLPSAKFIAIHAAIAEILHTSGAGRFFDELFKKFGDGGRSSPVRCWEDFENMVQDAKLRECVEQAIHVT
ncbi:hypothetical protein F5887DRAFT_1283776 [Amanita rubescens]|nr:hypothetical protein F5887DRAFT_1283776 [Amanita rubescens]